ncbi:hypothetical protein PMAYCL1PPCAC_18092, partial [Pristionchus mayeri]
QMVVVDHQPARLWVGPLLLIFVVTLIYIFSVLPQTRSNGGMDPLPSHPSYGKSERILTSFRMMGREREDSLVGEEECNLHGYWNDTNQSCHCIHSFEGPRCLTPVCANGGVPLMNNCRCPLGFGGQFCEDRCVGGKSENRNDTSHCLCEEHKFGGRCEFLCMNGRVEGGECICHQGFEGSSCEVCSPSSSSCISASSTRRSSINSRLTLSGLSFCLITIGLLCVTASRRRRLSSTPSDGFFSLSHPRSRSFPCPSSLRVSSSSRSARSSPLHPPPLPPLTPPPIYRSIENLPEGSAPPSYEEATAIQIDPPSDELDDDKTIN